MRNKKQKDPAYLRKQGNRGIVGHKERNITFSYSKHIQGEGQSIEEWNILGLMGQLSLMLKAIGSLTIHEVKQRKLIKEYHKVCFPPESEFTEPKHVQNVTWAVMHITPKSKEVVAGYIEDDVFYIVFLDKDHKFWPMSQ